MTHETEPVVLRRTSLVVHDANSLRRSTDFPPRTIYGPMGIGKPYPDSTGVVVIGDGRSNTGLKRYVAFELSTGITLQELAANTRMEINHMLRCLAEGVQAFWGEMNEATRLLIDVKGATARIEGLNPYVIISLGRDRLQEKTRIQSV